MTLSATSDDRLTFALQWCRSRLGTELDAELAASDASSRRYLRITLESSLSYILMDAPRQGESVASFVRIGELMRQAGLNTPQLIAADYRNGLLLLSDLGTTTYLSAITERGDEPLPLYRAAIDSLISWQLASRPARLPQFSARALRAELELFTDWYLQRHCGVCLTDPERQKIDTFFNRIVEQVSSQPQVYVHRDFMPRNLMVTTPSPGVLDYQDAVIGPASYDPVCLYRDAFLSWPEEFVYAGLQRYWQQAREAGIALPTSFAEFWRDCQWTSLQRHFKVMGIFARLFYRDGKQQYLRDSPRFVAYLRSAAEPLGYSSTLEHILQLGDKVGAKPE